MHVNRDLCLLWEDLEGRLCAPNRSPVPEKAPKVLVSEKGSLLLKAAVEEAVSKQCRALQASEHLHSTLSIVGSHWRTLTGARCNVPEGLNLLFSQLGEH